MAIDANVMRLKNKKLRPVYGPWMLDWIQVMGVHGCPLWAPRSWTPAPPIHYGPKALKAWGTGPRAWGPQWTSIKQPPPPESSKVYMGPVWCTVKLMHPWFARALPSDRFVHSITLSKKVGPLTLFTQKSLLCCMNLLSCLICLHNSSVIAASSISVFSWVSYALVLAYIPLQSWQHWGAKEIPGKRTILQKWFHRFLRRNWNWL